MAIRKEITKDNELYLWMNGKLIYKRWLNYGYSKVFDKTAYNKNTFVSITADLNGKTIHRKKLFINGAICKSEEDFWNQYVSEIGSESGKYFKKNSAAFHDAMTSKGFGFPGDCIIEIIGTKNLEEIFGKPNFTAIITLFREADFVDLITEKIT